MKNPNLLNIKVTLSITVLSVFILGCATEGPLEGTRSRSNQIDCRANIDSFTNLPKKIAVIRMPPSSEIEAPDFPVIQELFHSQYIRELNRSGRFLTSDATKYAFSKQWISVLGHRATDPREQITLLAKEYDSQLVILPQFTLMDSAAEEERWFSNSPVRKITLEATIFDGFSGTLMQRFIISRLIDGESLESQSRNITTGNSSNESIRPVLTDLVKEAVNESHRLTSCMPIGGRIIAVGQSRLTINIGATSSLLSEDQFKLIHTNLLDTDRNGTELQHQSEIGTITLDKIEPNKAHGFFKLNADATAIRPKVGDYVLGY